MTIEAGSRLRTIGKAAFRNCHELAKMNFPERLEKIGQYTFKETKLEDVEFPASLRTISQGAFNGCKSLRTAKSGAGSSRRPGKLLELPSALRRMEYNAFAATDELQSIKFPDSLEYIGDRSFLGSGL